MNAPEPANTDLECAAWGHPSLERIGECVSVQRSCSCLYWPFNVGHLVLVNGVGVALLNRNHVGERGKHHEPVEPGAPYSVSMLGLTYEALRFVGGRIATAQLYTRSELSLGKLALLAKRATAPNQLS